MPMRADSSWSFFGLVLFGLVLFGRVLFGLILFGLIWFGLGLLPSRAQAYELFSFVQDGKTRYLKWGDKRAPSMGGQVTWSIVPAGVAGDPDFCAAACPGNSVDQLRIEVAPGAGFADHSLESLRPRIAVALNRWAAAAGMRFVAVADAGLPINGPTALPPLTGHIRISAFAFSAEGAAVGYAPPPNGGSAAGDLIFNSQAFFQFAAAGEGQTYDPSFAPNDFETLLMHELGHTLGLAHPPYDGSCPLMQVNPACQSRVNRVPDADDRAGLQFLYAGIFTDGFD